MKTNYILVDFENVQPDTIKVTAGVPVKVQIFLGLKQTKVPVDLAVSLQALGDQVEYIKMSGSGKNVLDFHIAYWIGRLSERDPKGYFHIVSKDKGFDHVVAHLKQNKILSQRVNAISEIEILKGNVNSPIGERVSLFTDALIARGKSRPRKRQTLRNTISASFMKDLTEAEVDDLISKLEKKGVISFKEDAVSYHLK